MTSTQVLDLKGKKVGELTLEGSVFASETKQGPMHTYLVRQLANARAGSASSKTRSEVRGGGRKPWRQKGTGRARAGSIRSPLWHGGGVVFGPKPKDYSISMPQKMRHVALRSALSASKDKLLVVKDFAAINEPKTKLFFQALKDLKVDGKKVLLILDFSKEESSKLERAARNVDRLKVIRSEHVNVKDLLEYEVILISEGTVKTIGDTLKKKVEEKTIKKSPIKKGPRKAKVKAAPKAKEKSGKEAREVKAKAKAEKAAAKAEAQAEGGDKKEDKKAKSDKAAKPAPKADGKSGKDNKGDKKKGK